MSPTVRRALFLSSALIFFLLPLAGCGPNHGPSLAELPRFPGAVPGEAMAQSGFGGIMGGTIEQFTTTESFDDVVSYYDGQLRSKEPEIEEYTSELGRQKVYSMQRGQGMIAVTIQEFEDEDEVYITLMGAGM